MCAYSSKKGINSKFRKGVNKPVLNLRIHIIFSYFVFQAYSCDIIILALHLLLKNWTMDSSQNEVKKEIKAKNIESFDVPIENGIKFVNEVTGYFISKCIFWNRYCDPHIRHEFRRPFICSHGSTLSLFIELILCAIYGRIRKLIFIFGKKRVWMY